MENNEDFEILSNLYQFPQNLIMNPNHWQKPPNSKTAGTMGIDASSLENIQEEDSEQEFSKTNEQSMTFSKRFGNPHEDVEHNSIERDFKKKIENLNPNSKFQVYYQQNMADKMTQSDMFQQEQNQEEPLGCFLSPKEIKVNNKESHWMYLNMIKKINQKDLYQDLHSRQFSKQEEDPVQEIFLKANTSLDWNN